MSAISPISPSLSPAISTSDIVWSDPQRQAQFATWLTQQSSLFGLDPTSLRLASADASFRRYFRIQSQHASLIIMDAPPERENSQPFVEIAKYMADAGLNVPEVLAWDRAQGFLLLTDLGTHTMMQSIDPQAPPPLALYSQAVDALVQWQLASRPDVLPVYDRALLLREMALFPDWYVQTHRQVVLDEAQRNTLEQAFASIVVQTLRWPSVYVHRDFMPRNLMVMPQPAQADPLARPKLGVLDFQDAVYGPITYDIASLMRDAFLSWEEDFCLDVTVRYWEKARKAGLPVGDDFGAFYRGVEWMGLQRHLKVAGIFARLTLRDGKPQYLADTPRFIGYIRATCARYRELGPLLRLVERIEGLEAPATFVFGRS